MAFTLLQHNREIVARANNLQPIEVRTRQILLDGKRDQLTRGVDVEGRPFVGVKPETRKTRDGIGPPLAPQGAAARIVTGYEVVSRWAAGGLKIAMGWSMPWVKYHATGTKRMPRRDPTGVRRRDNAAIGKALRDWVMQGRR